MFRFLLSALKRSSQRTIFVGMLVSLTGSFTVSLSAGSYTWKGANNGLWNTASNWNEGLVPISISPSIILFNSSSTANPSNMNNDISGLTGLGFIITNPAADININAGNGFSLGSSGIDMSGAQKNFSSNLPIVVGAAQTWNVALGKLLTLSDTVHFANNLTLNSGSNSGAILLSGANDSSGTITVSGGTLKLGSATALGSITGKTTISGTSATLDLNGINYSTAEPLELGGAGMSNNGALINSSSTAASFAGPITLVNNTTIGATSGDIALTGMISGGNNLIKTGSKTLTFASVANTFGGSGDSIYVNEGKLVLNVGSGNLAAAHYTTFVIGDGTGTDTLQCNTQRGISSFGKIIINGGGVFLNYVGNEVAPISSSSTQSKIVNSSMLTINTRWQNSQFDGVISGGGWLQLYGSGGSLNLTNANTYTGVTNIWEPWCILYVTNTNGSATGTNLVTAQWGSTLSGNGIIGGPVNMLDSAIISPGYQGPGKLSLGGGLRLVNKSVLEFEAGTSSDTIAITGDLTLDGILKVSALSGFGAGTYIIMAYTGTLTNNLLTVASMPSGFYGTIDLTTPNQVKLSVIAVTGPIISANVTPFSNVIVKDSLIPSDTFIVSNNGIGTMNYSITAKNSSAWLSASPSTGSCTTEKDTIICHFGSSFPTAQRSSRGYDLVFKDSIYADHFDENGELSYTDIFKTARFDTLWFDIFLDTLIVSSTGSLNNSIQIPIQVNYYSTLKIPVGVEHSSIMPLTSRSIGASLSVYTLTGRKIKTADVNNGIYRQMIKSITNGLAPGVYVIVEKSIVSGVTKQNVYRFSR